MCTYMYTLRVLMFYCLVVQNLETEVCVIDRDVNPVLLNMYGQYQYM